MEELVSGLSEDFQEEECLRAREAYLLVVRLSQQHLGALDRGWQFCEVTHSRYLAVTSISD